MELEMMPEGERQLYVTNLETLVAARTEQLRAVGQAEKLSRMIIDAIPSLRKAPDAVKNGPAVKKLLEMFPGAFTVNRDNVGG